MASTKRRSRPIRKPSNPQQRKRRVRKPARDWRDVWMKSLIVLVLVVDLVLIFFIVRQCSAPTELPPDLPLVEDKKPQHPLQIEVLNGCGVTGVANRFTDFLRERGFDVIKTDNFESFNVLKTVVIDRRGVRDNGIRIAEALGLGNERVLQEVNEAYLIDATVVVGKDYRQLNSWSLMEH